MAKPVQRGRGWNLAPMFNGKKYHGTFTTEADAYAWLAEARRCNGLGLPIPDPKEWGKAVRNAKVQTLGQLAENVYKTRWASKKSGASLYEIARCFVNYSGPERSAGDALTYKNVSDYVEHRMGLRTKVSGSTINRHLSAISVLAKKALALDLISKKLDLEGLWQEEGVARMRWFTVEEEGQILARLASWGHHDYIDLFVFLADTGGRLGETRKLSWDDIRGRQITFEGKNTKNGRDRTIVATPRVQEALARRYAATGGAGGPFKFAKTHVLRTLWSHLRSHITWMGDDCVIHTYRHTCASRLVQRGVDIYRVMNWMGHRNIQTTMRYAKLAPNSMDDLADVLAHSPTTSPPPVLAVAA